MRRNRRPRRRPLGSSFSASFEALVSGVDFGWRRNLGWLRHFVDWPRRHPSPVPAPDVQGSQRCGRFDFSDAKCKYAPGPCYRSKQLALGGMYPNHNERLFGFLFVNLERHSLSWYVLTFKSRHDNFAATGLKNLIASPAAIFKCLQPQETQLGLSWASDCHKLHHCYEDWHVSHTTLKLLHCYKCCCLC